jgi:hypothetical protein
MNFSSSISRGIPRENNGKANALAQQASGYVIKRGKFEKHEWPMSCKVVNVITGSSESVDPGDTPDSDWRHVLIKYLEDLSSSRDRKVPLQALRYTLLDGELYRRTIDGVLLRCVGREEAKIAMREVHEGMCRAHQAAHKMKWMLRRVGLFWPAVLKDCFNYYKGCASC